MRKTVFLAILIAFAISAGVRWSPAKSDTRAAELLSVLPDGGAVAVIDFQKITASTLWSTISAQEKLKSAIDKAQSELSDLGVKLTDVHTVAIVFPASNMSNPTIAVTGGFEQTDLLARLRSSGKVKLTSEKYKGFDIYNARSVRSTGTENSNPNRKAAVDATNSATVVIARQDATFAFVDGATLVAGDTESVRNSIDVKTGAKSSIAQNTKMAEALAQNPGAAIRFALTLTPNMVNGLQSSDLPIPDFSSITMIFGTIDVTSGIDLNATLRSDTAEHAKVVADRLSGLLGMAKGFLGAMTDPKMAPIAEALKSVTITNADIDVKITGNVPMELLNTLFSSTAKKA